MPLKTLQPAMLQLQHAGHRWAWYDVDLDDHYDYKDLFPSTFWVHCQDRLRVKDKIYINRRDGSFAVCLMVIGQADNGELVVEPWPKQPDIVGMQDVLDGLAAKTIADSARPTIVPLGNDGEPRAKVEFLPACKWRVRGWDGQEVSRDHPTETVAKQHLARYLSKLNMTMPPQSEVDAAKAKVAEAAAKAALETPAAKKAAAAKAA